MTRLWKRLAQHLDREGATNHRGAAHPDFRWTYEPAQASEDPGRVHRDETERIVDDPAPNPGKACSGMNAPAASEGIPQPFAAKRKTSLPAASEDRARSRPALSYLLHRLDEAEARWQTSHEFPSVELLQAGLSALEDGWELDAGRRSLLLRAALYHGRGILTALRHQDDPERTGLVLADALASGEARVPVETVRDLSEHDPHGRFWRPALLFELRATANSVDSRRRVRAVQALWVLAPDGSASAAPEKVIATPVDEARRMRVRFGRRPALSLFFLLCLAGAGIWAAMARGQQGLMVRVPGGEYALPLARSGGEPVAVTIDSFTIDRHEVTNRQYRTCYGRGRCRWPVSGDAVGIKDYFVNPAYDMYPVVNVDWHAAAEYCRAQGKRLPTEEEWLAAAVAAPAINRLYTYPWGDAFGGGRANTQESGRGSPAIVGSHSPAGDSPSRAADMAGNAAEWTATSASEQAGIVVKGGSYRDDRLAAQASAYRIVAVDAAEDWIGFRCAAD
jgi:hypothetical protein